jgi:hypothetical protein
VHLDGMRKTHDYVCDREGVFDKAVAMIREGVRLGYDVMANTTVFRDTDVDEVETLCRLLTGLGVSGMLVSLLEDVRRVLDGHRLGLLGVARGPALPQLRDALGLRGLGGERSPQAPGRPLPPVRMEPPRLIATALPEELGAILRRTRGLRRRAGGSFEGMLGGRSVRIACTGSGPRRAARELDRLLAEGPASLVIGAGIAGALTPGLALGDVVVARRVRDGHGEAPAPDEAWHGRCPRAAPRAWTWSRPPGAGRRSGAACRA